MKQNKFQNRSQKILILVHPIMAQSKFFFTKPQYLSITNHEIEQISKSEPKISHSCAPLMYYFSIRVCNDTFNLREGHNPGRKLCRMYSLSPYSPRFQQVGRGRPSLSLWSQPMSTAVHRSPNKLWRSISIFNLWKTRTIFTLT